ncbi:hypothetical protein WA026_013507 [Henosepilachna vigintioctopunctata]|uniref:Uncharacterized protein n=1 Tax=Henosepilachna vigintioctopunctata TaxID=420089 RepID=A0AAW1V664_9CUCU
MSIYKNCDHSFSLDLVKQKLTDQSYKNNEETKLGKGPYKDLQNVTDHSKILVNQLDIGRSVSNSDNTQEYHSGAIKMKSSADMNTQEDSICIKDEIIDENGKILPKEDFLTNWKSHTAKLEDGLPVQKKMKNHKCDKCAITARHLDRLLELTLNLYT